MLRQTAAENTEPDADLVRQVKASAGYVKSETEIQTAVTASQHAEKRIPMTPRNPKESQL
jgi:hypothetical protein